MGCDYDLERLDVQRVATLDPIMRTATERYRWRHPSINNHAWSRLYVSFAAARSGATIALKHASSKGGKA